MAQKAGPQAVAARPERARPTRVQPRAPVSLKLDSATGSVAVVAAPAGYGKTAQVATWAASDRRPVAWVALDRCDDDPDLLLLDVERALVAAAGIEAGRLPTSPSLRHHAAMAAPRLARVLDEVRSAFILVFDDAHTISNPAAVELLNAVVQHAPPLATVVVIGRTQPPLALARQHGHARVVQVGVEDLAVGVDEARAILDAVGLRPDDAELGRVVRRTGGWPVGIRLAGIDHQLSGRDGDRDLLTGLDPFIAAYLREEWLEGLPDEEQDFLRQVSVLEWMSASLCDELLQRTDSGALLHQLHVGRLALLPMERRGDVFRMHELLRDVLQDDFERSDAPALRRAHARARALFEARGDVPSAVDHAFRAGELDVAERLVVEHGVLFHTNGRGATVAGWIERFPAGHVSQRPGLALVASLAALSAGDGASALAWIRFAEASVAPTESDRPDHDIELKVAVLRALISPASTLVDLADAQQGCDELGPGVWRAAACYAIGALRFSSGDLAGATDALVQGAAEAHVVSAPGIEASCRAHLAIAAEGAGDQARAVALAREARELAHAKGVITMPTLVIVSAASALAQALSGHPDRAREDLAAASRALAHLEGVAGWANVQARIAMAKASLLVDDRGMTRTFIEEAAGLVEGQPDASQPRAQISALEAQLEQAVESLPSGPSALSSAEVRVLHHLHTTMTHEEIAARLYVSRNTVKSHASAIYRKLGVSSRRQAVEVARTAGLLPPDGGRPPA